MTTGVKIAIGVGAVVVAAGVGYLIYNSVSGTKQVPSGSGSTGGSQTGGGSQGTGGQNTGGSSNTNNFANTLNNLLNVVNTIRTYTAESFPLKAGMKGPNVKLMQDALRTKYNKLNVASDGMFGIYTGKALLETGYMNPTTLSVSKEDFDKILAGVKK